MRLIDADEFKKQIAGMAIINDYPADKANKMCELIDCQKTAYDVDKTVEQLKESAFIPGDRIGVSELKIIMEEKALRIVKAGGIE